MTHQRETGRVDPAAAGPRDDGAGAPESTVELLARARAGDEAALNEVFARAIPLLKRWASGRLPRWARDMLDTDDQPTTSVSTSAVRFTSAWGRCMPRSDGC